MILAIIQASTLGSEVILDFRLGASWHRAWETSQLNPSNPGTQS